MSPLDFSSSASPVVLGDGGGGSGWNGYGMAGASAQIENFPLCNGQWEQDNLGELWSTNPNLCFVNIFNVHNFTQLFWFEQLIGQNPGLQTGNCAFWSAAANLSTITKIWEGGVLDASYFERFTFPTPLDISGGPLLIFASDSPLGGSTSGIAYVQQAKMIPSVVGLPFPRNSAFLATHVGGHNSPYPNNTIPVCPDPEDAKYYMAMYVKVGVK